MAVLGIDLNDAGAWAFGTAPDGSVNPVSLAAERPDLSSFRAVHQGRISWGEPARKRLLIDQDRVEYKFWRSFSRPPDTGPDAIAASMVKEHLAEIWRRASEKNPENPLAVVAAIPGGRTKEWRAQLLHFCNQAGLPARTFVDAPTAIAWMTRDGTQQETMLVGDLDLGSLHLSVVTVTETLIQTIAQHDIGPGAIDWEKRVLTPCRDAFVKQTPDRFDPWGTTEYEQQLFDQMPRLFEQIAHAGGAGVLTVAGRKATMDHAAVAGGIKRELREAAEKARGVAAMAGGNAPARLILTERVARIPELAKVLEAALRVPVKIVRSSLAAEAAAHIAAHHARFGLPEGAQYVGKFDPRRFDPTRESPPPAPKATERRAVLPRFHEQVATTVRATAPTHLFFQGAILPLPLGTFSVGSAPADGPALALESGWEGLRPQHFRLRRASDGLAVEPLDGSTWLNGTALPPREVRNVVVGDIITAGSEALAFMTVSVVSSDAPP